MSSPVRTVNQPMLWALDSAFDALENASAHGRTAATCIQYVRTDSRAVQPGDAFVALRGERFDAHDFIPQVVAQGARVVVVERIVPVPEGSDCVQWVVPNTRIALGQWARAWRMQFDLPVIAVTGSNGKTTTKEMTACIVQAQAGEQNVWWTQGNLNNEVGVPLTLFNLRAEHTMAVIELGMNHPGEIAGLAEITQPTVALVNNAQREHQEFMATVEAVARENGAVFSALKASGVAVFPNADEYTWVWNALTVGRPRLTFGIGRSDTAEHLGVQTQPSDAGQTLTFSGPFQCQVELKALGQHNALNAAASAACAWAAGCSEQAIAQGLSAFVPVNGRLQPSALPNGGLLINDTYNANPDSVRAAIDVLAATSGAPRIFVLGDMGEVGDNGPAFHREVGAYAREKHIEHFFTLGALCAHAADAFGAGAHAFEDIESLIQHAQAKTQQPAHVLVKGSRFMKMERVVAALSAPALNTAPQGASHAA